MTPWRATILAGGILMAGAAQTLWASPSTPESAGYAGAETCATCHQAEYEEWKGSAHAGAHSQTFLAYWERLGKSPECLQCHTTGFELDRRAFAEPGVSCEACHGPLHPGHPDTETMPLLVDSTACMGCHRQTYLEWQLSGHAKRNIRCFDCHAVHRQGLRQADTEQQCGACHAQRLEDFAHATHHQQGLTCTTCHMPSPRTSGIGGTGAPAHSFFVGAETCAACHEEMVHSSHKISSLTQEIVRLAQTAEAQRLEQAEFTVRHLELALDIQRARTVKATVAALLLGLGLGTLGRVLIRRRKNGQRK